MISPTRRPPGSRLLLRPVSSATRPAARGSSRLVEAVDDHVQNSVQSDLLHGHDLARDPDTLRSSMQNAGACSGFGRAGVGQVHPRVPRVRAEKQAVDSRPGADSGG